MEGLDPAPNKPCVYDVMELRAAIDTARMAAGMGVAAWTDPAIVAGTVVKVRAVHFTELRSRIQELWTQAGLGAVPEFRGGAVVGNGTRVIRRSDVGTCARGWGSTSRARGRRRAGRGCTGPTTRMTRR